ncbi:MAG: methyltransferase [Pirellulaceae bacterium]
MKPHDILTFALLCISLAVGCSRHREDLDYSYDVVQTWEVENLQHGVIVQFESVFWEADDTVSLRKLITDDTICTGRSVLEIGTGTGLISIFCVQHGADSVVATDINPAAVANARYNVAMLAEGMPVEVRSVSTKAPGAFAVIKDKERFDLIVSNPPWEDGKISKPADHAFYDPDFALMDSLLDGLPKHLKPGGRCLLAYGHVPAIERLQKESGRRGYEFKILDDRELADLEKDFLPGMLVEIRVPLKQKVSSGNASSGVPENPPIDVDHPAAIDSK